MDISEIKYGILETSGNLSIVLKKKQVIEEENFLGLPFMFICDGKVNQKALNLYSKNEEWLKKSLKNTDISNVLYAGVTETGKFYFQKREES